jgi:predicted DNA-binding protein
MTTKDYLVVVNKLLLFMIISVHMLPLIPKSVKMEPEISARLKATANLIGYSENQFIVEAVKAMLDVAEDKNNAVPRVVVLIRSARSHQAAPPVFGKATKSQRFGHRVKRWWGA